MRTNTQVLNPVTMVNYTNVLTSVPNEIYVTKTESPDSLASLIKDNIIIEFSLIPLQEESPMNLEEKSTSVILHTSY